MTEVLRTLFVGWDAEPIPLVLAASAMLVYVSGARHLRAAGSPAAPSRLEAGCLAIGVAGILVALVSPLDALALQLQWVHMVQHLLLLLVAPPLIVLARPLTVGGAALPGPLQRAVARTRFEQSSAARRGSAAMGTILLFIGVLWVWHVPGLYNLTLRDQWVHDMEHTSFLAVGLLFWVMALARTATPSLGTLGRSVLVLAGMIGSWLLAVYIGYAPTVLYAYQGVRSLSPASDQQVAAGIMWVPGSVPFVVVLVVLLARWFDNDARAAAAELPRASQASP